MSRYFKKIAGAAKERIDTKIEERKEWSKVKKQIEKEERVKHERQKTKDRLKYEREKARAKLREGSLLKRGAISGLKLTGKALQYAFTEDKPAQKKRRTKKKETG